VLSLRCYSVGGLLLGYLFPGALNYFCHLFPRENRKLRSTFSVLHCSLHTESFSCRVTRHSLILMILSQLPL
jgi:hypothetical protein